MNIAHETVRPSWKVFLAWLVANFIGLLVGGAILFFMAFILSGGFGAPSPQDLQANQSRSFIQQLLFGGLMGGMLGLILGICQAFVVMPYLKNTSIWVLATITGFAIGMASEFVLPPSISLSWALTGMLIGILQWIVLRKRVQKAWLWVVVNFGMGLSMELAGVWPWGILLFLIAGNIFTGITLAWLITSQKKVEGA